MFISFLIRFLDNSHTRAYTYLLHTAWYTAYKANDKENMLGISRFLLLLRFAVTTPNQRTKARHITAVSYTVYIGKPGQLRMHTYIVYLTDLHFHMKGIIRPAGLTPTHSRIDRPCTMVRKLGPTRQTFRCIPSIFWRCWCCTFGLLLFLVDYYI